MNKKIKIIINILLSVSVALVFCVPFLNGYIRVGADVTFHMNRIEALKESIQNGYLYPYVYLNQNFGYGYGTPSFYGQIFLYPFAILRLIGLSPAWTWRLLIFTIIFFASLSISYVYRKLFKDDRIISSLLVSILYLFNTFLLNRVYARGAIGEIMSLIFIPLIILNIHKYIKDNADNYIELGVLFSCLLLTHNISFIIMVIVFGVTIIINIKDVLKNKLPTLIKAIFLGGLLSLFFILPMIEQLRNGIYFINNSISRDRLTSGMLLKDYFSFIINDSGGNGIGVGAALLLIPIICFNKKDYLYLMITGYILVFVSSFLFPWKYVPLFGFIQFTSRIITVGISYLALCSSYGIMNCKNIIKKITSVGLCSLTIILFAIGCYGIYNSWGAINDETNSDFIKSGEFLYDNWYSFPYSVPETSGLEYLPQNNDYDYRNEYWFHYACDEGHNQYPVFYVDRFDYIYRINPNGHRTLTFPRIFYKGYVVDVYENEKYVSTLRTKIDSERYAFVSIDVPEEYRTKEIQYVLKYSGTPIQKVSITISLLTLVFTIYLLIRRKAQNVRLYN